MRMTIREALAVMGLTEQNINREMIKQSYRRLASKYHPDKNPHGLVKMQNINMAYDCLSSASEDDLTNTRNPHCQKKDEWRRPTEFDYFDLWGLVVTVAHRKIFVWGDTFQHKEKLKKHGYRWCPDKKTWWRYDR